MRDVYIVYPLAQGVPARFRYALRRADGTTTISLAMATPRGSIPLPSLVGRLAQHGVLAAGMGVFAKRGFAATRVEDLLEAAGLARRTFYKHFKSKEDVLAAIYDLTTSELVRFVRGAADGADDPLEGIYAGLDAYLDFHVGNAQLLRVLVQQAIRSDSPLAPMRKRFRAELVELLAAANAAGGGPTRDPFVYVALVSALEGLSLTLLEEGASAKEVARAKAVTRSMLDRVLGSSR